MRASARGCRLFFSPSFFVVLFCVSMAVHAQSQPSQVRRGIADANQSGIAGCSIDSAAAITTAFESFDLG
jgi:hypothetical protein